MKKPTENSTHADLGTVDADTTTDSGGKLPQVAPVQVASTMIYATDTPSVILARELDVAATAYEVAERNFSAGQAMVADLRATRDAARAAMLSIRNRLGATAMNALANRSAAKVNDSGIVGIIPSQNGGSSLPKSDA
jgi:hypothetical protein